MAQIIKTKWVVIVPVVWSASSGDDSTPTCTAGPRAIERTCVERNLIDTLRCGVERMGAATERRIFKRRSKPA